MIDRKYYIIHILLFLLIFSLISCDNKSDFKTVNIEIINDKNEDLLLFLNFWMVGYENEIVNYDNLNILLKRKFAVNKLIFSNEQIEFNNDNLHPDDLKILIEKNPVFLNIDKNKNAIIELIINNDLIPNDKNEELINYSIVAFNKDEVFNNLSDFIIIYQDKFRQKIETEGNYINIGEIKSDYEVNEIEAMTNFKLFNFEGNVSLE